MYTRIKELADSAVALQNKINMEAALREISGICDMELSTDETPVAVVYDKDNPKLIVGGSNKAHIDAASKSIEAGKKAAKK